MAKTLTLKAVRAEFEYSPGSFRPCFGERGTLTHVGDKLQCHICGHSFHGLGPHVWMAHGLSAREYKIEFMLPMGTPLNSQHLTRVLKLANGPRARDYVTSAAGAAMRAANRELAAVASQASTRHLKTIGRLFRHRADAATSSCLKCSGPVAKSPNRHPRKYCPACRPVGQRRTGLALDYEKIAAMMAAGMGYRAIAQALEYRNDSVKKACRSIRKQKALSAWSGVR